MLPVAAKLGLPNIVNYHVPDVFASTVLRQKVLSERRCGDFGEVFVLGNGDSFSARRKRRRKANGRPRRDERRIGALHCSISFSVGGR